MFGKYLNKTHCTEEECHTQLSWHIFYTDSLQNKGNVCTKRNVQIFHVSIIKCNLIYFSFFYIFFVSPNRTFSIENWSHLINSIAVWNNRFTFVLSIEVHWYTNRSFVYLHLTGITFSFFFLLKCILNNCKVLKLNNNVAQLPYACRTSSLNLCLTW